MSKTDPVKKLVNGEIADADDVNQIAENIGTEGGAIPYSDTDQNRSTLGDESLGNVTYPWGALNMNRDADINEIDTVSHTIASTVTLSQLRKFISQKDTPLSYSGQAAKQIVVSDAEDGLVFIPSSGSIEMFDSNGTWTCPAGITHIKVIIIGGGGGGGGSAPGDDGGGGGGGAETIVHYFKVIPGNTYSIVVGAGGAGGANDTDGVTGGDSSFTGEEYTITATGGIKGLGTTLRTGGAGASGDITVANLDGANASGSTGGAGGGVWSYAAGSGGDGTGVAGGGGGGGSSIFGRGGNGGNNGVNGVEGGIGAGGGGGGDANSGGNGGDGLVLLIYNSDSTPA